VIARAAEAFGGLDVLVNNAGGAPEGSGPRASFLDVGDADWHAMLELNLLSAVRASRAALPLLLERGGGAIVNVSSVNGRRPFPFVVDYSASKAAMTNLTKALSEEFAPRGVRVNAVSPGPVRTPWWTDDGGLADVMAAQAARTARAP
jgi:NAD(P)-dependent dehydrogenase (short-subunit alcohol dehydrogenase family)